MHNNFQEQDMQQFNIQQIFLAEIVREYGYNNTTLTPDEYVNHNQCPYAVSIGVLFSGQ